MCCMWCVVCPFLKEIYISPHSPRLIVVLIPIKTMALRIWDSFSRFYEYSKHRFIFCRRPLPFQRLFENIFFHVLQIPKLFLVQLLFNEMYMLFRWIICFILVSASLGFKSYFLECNVILSLVYTFCDNIIHFL